MPFGQCEVDRVAVVGSVSGCKSGVCDGVKRVEIGIVESTSGSFVSLTWEANMPLSFMSWAARRAMRVAPVALRWVLPLLSLSNVWHWVSP